MGELMQGMSRTTGKPLSGIEHIRQSVQDILSTPLGSRRMLMTYGSDLPLLVDNPSDRVTEIRIIMATAVALARWEPRIQIESITVLNAGGGKLSVTISASDIETGQPVTMEDVTL